jgi:hypothetical protein
MFGLVLALWATIFLLSHRPVTLALVLFVSIGYLGSALFLARAVLPNAQQAGGVRTKLVGPFLGLLIALCSLAFSGIMLASRLTTPATDDGVGLVILTAFILFFSAVVCMAVWRLLGIIRQRRG